MQEYAKKMYKQFFDSFNIVVKTFVSSAPEAGPEGGEGGSSTGSHEARGWHRREVPPSSTILPVHNFESG